MKNVLRIVAGLVGALFFNKRTSVDHQPSKTLQRHLGMPLLEGVGLECSDW